MARRRGARSRRISVKTPAQLERMRDAGAVVAEVLWGVEQAAAPGVSTAELDALAFDIIRSRGAVPSFLGYEAGGRRYPASTCISLNDVVVHGIPSPATKLQRGDIVGVDVGACYRGWHADAAVTLAIGEVSPEAARLLAATREALLLGIAQAVAGRTLQDIGGAVQAHVEGSGFSVVRALVGHGIGRDMHEPPSVPNFVTNGATVRLQANMTLAIEPMVNAGGPDVVVEPDGWTTRTADRSLSAHFEHTVVVGPEAADIITVRTART
jgi:methionyl aminopeptidase